jgi:hypothetical protein
MCFDSNTLRCEEQRGTSRFGTLWLTPLAGAARQMQEWNGVAA